MDTDNNDSNIYYTYRPLFLLSVSQIHFYFFYYIFFVRSVRIVSVGSSVAISMLDRFSGQVVKKMSFIPSIVLIRFITKRNERSS